MTESVLPDTLIDDLIEPASSQDIPHVKEITPLNRETLEVVHRQTREWLRMPLKKGKRHLISALENKFLLTLLAPDLAQDCSFSNEQKNALKASMTTYMREDGGVYPPYLSELMAYRFFFGNEDVLLEEGMEEDIVDSHISSAKTWIGLRHFDEGFQKLAEAILMAPEKASELLIPKSKEQATITDVDMQHQHTRGLYNPRLLLLSLQLLLPGIARKLSFYDSTRLDDERVIRSEENEYVRKPQARDAERVPRLALDLALNNLYGVKLTDRGLEIVQPPTATQTISDPPQEYV